jgi:cell division protein FtsB
MAMLEDARKLVRQQLKQLSDVRNVVLYLFVLVVLAIAWSSVKTIQSNYELQKAISTLKQQNEVIKLTNQNIALQNKYLQSDQYLEFAARQSLGLAAPGEKVMLVPKRVALKYVDPSLSKQTNTDPVSSLDTRSKYVKNLETWRDFLLGRKMLTD